MTPARPDVKAFDRTKIQAEILVPLIKHLEAELGRARAHQLVREGVGGIFREMAREAAKTVPLTVMMSSAAAEQRFPGILEYEVIREDEDVVQFNVTGCAFARFFQELGEPDLGFLLVCSADYALADGAGVTLERSSTIMQGGARCDFKWDLKPAAKG